MSSFPDPVAEGLARGWKVIDATAATLPEQFDCDVAIIGTGAGGGVSAEILAHAGLRVLMIEEGPLKSSRDFRMREADAYPQLYQESAARKTRDKAINIMQGRCVGGSTTVNWTSSFRTPAGTLAWWREHYGLADFTPEALNPWFERAERRLSIGPWLAPPNENNELLRRGAGRLGIPAPAIQRNVRGCLDLGYCGVGCPTNAKQSMLVTTVPAALDAGATLFTRARAARLEVSGGRVEALEVRWLDAEGLRPDGRRTRVRAAHFVLAGGAINSPALLLRSQAPDPHRLVGARTFLHPVVVSAATFDHRVDGFSGAPQTVYTDHFLDGGPIDGPIGYKLEAPPIHPVLFATTLQGFGKAHAQQMADFNRTHALIALMRDGFHPQAAGGRVELRGDGSPVLDYPLTGYIFEGARRALLSMAQIQFEAGAQVVYPVHELASGYRSWPEARAAIGALPMKPLLLRVVSAHVMGGCPIAADEQRGVARPDGVHWQLANLSVHDGSIFPTSIGANPQLSIYGITARLASGLATRLTGRAAPAFGEAANGGA
ncbi:MAG: FAD-binding protein [Lautropia sp.]|nr:FAD-binding protein [Lautropia sp.]MCL4701215.1 GMC family oxidoreductase [Burkholderiaceae bacterium]MDL1907647.1 FAD-binding protein [Betaproteobacteria bacterium PRO1]RIK86355.1 MAG: GMC family oxidoreductase [Burkholderiales bacterium]